MYVDRGLNDQWVCPESVQADRQGGYRLRLREPLGETWTQQIVSYLLPGSAGQTASVTCAGQAVPSQQVGDRLFLLVANLAPGEQREYAVTLGAEAAATPSPITVTETPAGIEVSNGLLSLRLPTSATDGVLRAPLLAVRRGGGAWIGSGRMETRHPLLALTTQVTEAGALWTTVQVAYEFAGGYRYQAEFVLRAGDDWCEVREESTLPVRLWPAPRPFREIGSLGASFWGQPLENLAQPCLRPFPTSNWYFDVRPGLEPDRLVTHSTASWEIMDLPLGSATLKTYTAMRPVNPFMDGGWLGVYSTTQDELLGVASLDISHWGIPDETIHPAHRTPGQANEVHLLDQQEAGTCYRFPVESMSRRWFLRLASRAESGEAQAAEITPGVPVRREPKPDMPLQGLRTWQGDLRLDKVKDWVLDWEDAGDAHPRVLCNRADLPAIREKVLRVPELRQAYELNRDLRSADRFFMEGEVSGLAAIEAATHGAEIVHGIIETGFAGRSYCIALARPLRRYALACDMQWDSFTPEEKREARRVCALTAYILTDGDWWQYTLRPGETTYLPNFNSDVFCCAGIIGMVLSDHPCSPLWAAYLVERMDLELEHHLREDGGGEENTGNYLISTWGQLYMPALWGLRNCGIKDYSGDSRVLGGARFLLKVLGPPDPRDHGVRQMPPVGHHPGTRKSPPLFAWLAAFVKDHDPALAANLMWAWRAVGAPVHNFYDHSGPTANPLTRHLIFHDPTIPEVAPERTSHNLPYVGAILVSHDFSGQGSYLLLKSGRVHSHHEDDEGSIHYFGRGVPLAVDGLPLQNSATYAQHNAVSFGKWGQPTGIVESFTTTPGADYVRSHIAPRAFCNDQMYFADMHRSGFTREIVLAKSPLPGGVEYVVLKDAACGPDPAQWNLDVLSREPQQTAPDRVWFPGHAQPGFGMGLEVCLLEPSQPEVQFEAGTVNERFLTPEGRAELQPVDLDWTVVEHWLMHVLAGPGTTFYTVLFPRRAEEPSPEIEYLEREETVRITHAEGQDLVFLRPNPWIELDVDGVRFQGRAGIARQSVGGSYRLYALDADRLALIEDLPPDIRKL
ncbi:MAG TPA: hypothetical protein VGM19_12380 [Armatimonadota bacterium]